MKTSILAFFGLVSIFTGAFSAPTAEAVPAKHAGGPTDIMSSLYTTVQAHTGTISKFKCLYTKRCLRISPFT